MTIYIKIPHHRRDHRLIAHEIGSRSQSNYRVTFDGSHSTFAFVENPVGRMVQTAIEANQPPNRIYWTRQPEPPTPKQ